MRTVTRSSVGQWGFTACSKLSTAGSFSIWFSEFRFSGLTGETTSAGRCMLPDRMCPCRSGRDGRARRRMWLVGVYPYYRLWLQLAVRRNHFLEPSRGVDTCPRWIDQASTPGPWDSWTSLLLCSSSGCSTQKTLRPRLSPAASIAAFPPSAVTRGAIASCEFW